MLKLRRLSESRIWLFLLPLMLLPGILFAQVATTTTSTTAVTLDVLLGDGQGVYEAFKGLGILAGISAAINALVNVSKFGPVRAFIKRKGWKWLRPVMAVLAGLVAGTIAGLAEGKAGALLIFYVVGGLFSGGGAIAIHELFNAIKGNRK